MYGYTYMYEVAGRDFIYTKGLTKGKEGTSTWICCLDDGLTFACACLHDYIHLLQRMQRRMEHTQRVTHTSSWCTGRRARRWRPDRVSFFRFRFFCTHSGWGQGRKCIAQTFFRDGTALFPVCVILLIQSNCKCRALYLLN